MRDFLVYLKPYRKKIVLSTLLLCVSAACDLLLPTLTSRILDLGVYEASRAGLFPYVLRTCLGMLGLAALSLGAISAGNWLVYQVTSGFTRDLRAALFARVHRMSFEQQGAIGTSNLVTRLTHDVGNLNWVVSLLCGSVVIIPLTFLGGVVLCLRKDLWMAAVLAVLVPLVILLTSRMSGPVCTLWEQSDDYCDKQNDAVRERIRGIRVIRAFDREADAHERIGGATKTMIRYIIRANLIEALLDPVILLLFNLGGVGIVYVGGLRLERGTGLTAGDVFAVVQYLGIVTNAILSASFALVMMPRVRVTLNRLREITSVPVPPETPAAGLRLSGAVAFDRVSFTYEGADSPALDEISLSIEPGQRVAVIGGTGAGKSTLVALLLGFRRPTGGTLTVDGRDVCALHPRDLRDNVSAVLQRATVYTGTVRENLLFGREDADEEALRTALADAQLLDFVDAQPEGLDYPLTQAGNNLSGGQKQRLSIARALLKDAALYIFDDSFSALDFLTEARLRAALDRRLAGKTRLVVTQRVSSAMHCDRIFVLADGALVGAGTHAELLKTCEVYREIYISQTGQENGTL